MHPNIPSLRRLLSVNPGEQTLKLGVDTFLAVALVDGADSTAGWYRKKLASLVNTFGPSYPLSSVRHADLLDWYVEQKSRDTIYGGKCSRPIENKGLSIYTLNGHVRAVRYFFKWMHEMGVIPENPAARLKIPRLPRTGKAGISDQAATAMLKAAKAASVRDYAIMMFVASTGCRLGGVTHLLLSDINIDSDDEQLRCQAKVREKGNKERIVFMTLDTVDALKAWLEIRPKCKSNRVFVGKDFEHEYHGLKERSIEDRFTYYAGQAGVTEDFNPHAFRHRYGRRMAQEGINLGVLSQLMGHECVDVTVRFYGIFATKQLQDAYEKYSRPLILKTL